MYCLDFKRVSLTFALLLMVTASCLAQAPMNRPLTNADIVNMVNAGIPESVIVRDIQLSPGSFVTTPDALIHLKQHHVPDGILAALVESQAQMAPVAPPPGMVFVLVPQSPS